jgi:hypothetical protein
VATNLLLQRSRPPRKSSTSASSFLHILSGNRRCTLTTVPSMTLSTQTFQGWYTAGILVAGPGRMAREAASARLMSSKVGKTATEMGSSDTDVAEGSLGAEPGMITDAATATGSGGISAMLGIEGLLGKSADYPNIVCAQDLLGAVHVMTGLPWWACIASVTIAGRLLIFPLVLAQQRAAARLTAAMPEITQVENEFQVCTTTTLTLCAFGPFCPCNHAWPYAVIYT